MQPKQYLVLAAILLGGGISLEREAAMADSSISFRIHNNQGDIKLVKVHDASDKNNPHEIETIKNLKAGATTQPIKIGTIPGASSGRANWNWDGKETNSINVENGKVYELSSGAESN
jgi:flagellar hook assembly protein FlgD